MSRVWISLVVLGLAQTLWGCVTQTPVAYGPIGDKALFGYKDAANSDGGHTVLVVMPGWYAPSAVRAVWDRRALELCPAGIDHSNVFRADRKENIGLIYASTPTVAQRVSTALELEGYVYCKAETKPAATVS